MDTENLNTDKMINQNAPTPETDKHLPLGLGTGQKHIKSTLEGYLQDWPSIRDLGYTGKDDSSEIEAWFASRHFPKWEINHGTQRLVFFKCWEGADRELSRMLGFGRAVFKLKKPSETQTDLGDLF